MNGFLGRLKTAFGFERIACRLILSWCCFIVTTLGQKDAFTQLSWMQDAELSRMAVMMLGFFVLFSCLAFLKEINTDALFLLFGSTVCIVYWCAFAPATNR